MGLFGIRTSKTKQQKRLDMFVSRWNAASTPEQQLIAAHEYLRAVMKHTGGTEETTRVAWDLFSFAARADGVEAELTTEFRNS